ncbi:hypothetical protein J7K70_02900 [bacterium]|nr:hypothetical protein [bacterium]
MISFEKTFGGEKGGDYMATYRRRKDSDTWHWCRNCSNWPASDYEEKFTKPSSGELCDQCKAKEKKGECKK